MSVFRRSVRAIGVIGALALAAGGVGTAHAGTTSAAHTKPAAAGTTPKSTQLTQDQAQALARKTGKPVAVTGAENSTDSTIANPNGTFTLTSYAQPVRKMVNGTWRNLDATLVKHANGTISPAESSDPLTLSAGGTAPLAQMRSGQDALSLTLPTSLPTPTLAGPTATYHNVLPGVDLAVTATTQGGFSDVYVVRDAKAAANPALDSLLTAHVATTGVKVETDQHGDIQALDSRGRLVFTAPAPDQWDSATNAPAATAGSPTTAHATVSSVAAAGTRAHRGHLNARVSGSTLTLTPDASALGNPDAVYPVYLDPSWAGAGGSNTDNGWSTVSENFPDTPEYDHSPESIADGEMQVGQSSAGFWADTLINFQLPLDELGTEGTSVKIDSARFYIINTGSTNCTAQAVDVFAPSATLVGGPNTNATWDDWFTSSRNLGSAVGTDSFANGWSTTACPAAPVGIGLSTAWISNDVAANKSVQTLALAGTSYSAEQYTGIGSGQNDYEVFNQTTPSLSITFEHGPAVPSNLSTSPNQPIIGNGSVSLNARAYDPDGGTLTATFTAYIDKHTSEVIKSGSLSVGSGNPTSMSIPQTTIDADVVKTAWGESSTNTTIVVDWLVTVTDSGGTSASSPVQNFTYSTATPGAPDISTDSADTSPCQGSTNYTVGTPVTLYFTHTGSVLPTSYTYQLNAGAGQTAKVDVNSNGSATIIPTHSINVLTVNAVAASTNIGQAASCEFAAAAAPNAAPGDLTGDGNPDALLVGQGNAALPAGLWLTPGTDSGQVSAQAANIGQSGTGLSATATGPSTFTGTQAITGMFSGTGFNDVLVYNPTTASAGSCSGNILNEDGQTTPLNPSWGTAVLDPVFTYVTDATDGTGVCASSIGNAGGLTSAETQGTSSPVYNWTNSTHFPDLLMVVNGSLYLEQAESSESIYTGVNTGADLSDTNPYCTANPTTCANNGTSTSWTNWTITTVDTADDIPAMFAINTSLNVIYYFNPTTMANLVYNYYNGSTEAQSPTQLTNLTPSNYLNLQATLANNTPALWATNAVGISSTYEPALSGFTTTSVDQAANVTAYTISGSTLTAAPTGGTVLHASNHDWPLDDQATQNGTITTAADTAGGLNLTGNSGVTGSLDDLFSPDASFNGTSGDLTASTGAVTPGTNDDFTVSAWVKPTALDGTVLSQKGADDPILQLSSTTDGAWLFRVNTTANGTVATYTTITGGTVRLGIWTQLTATYDSSTSLLTLYADGSEIAVATDSTLPTDATGDLMLGAVQTGASSTGGYYSGYLANVQTYDSVAAPLANPPGPSDFVPLTPTRILDTRSTSKIGSITGPVAAWSNTALPIAGTTIGGVSVPATGITAAAISITITGNTEGGYLTAYPDGTPQPISSTLNYATDADYTNNSITPVGTDGEIDLYNASAGTTQILVDITGYYTTNTGATNASTYKPLSDPTRILDTRSGTGAAEAQVGADKALTLTIAGNTIAGIPTDATGAEITGVALNITDANATGHGQLIAYPDGTSLPTTSNLNYYATNPTASTVVVPVGTDGKIDIYNQSSTPVDIVGDVSGYYTTDPTGQNYYPLGADRLLDTRLYDPANTGGTGAVGASATIALPVTNAITATDPTLVLNVTVTQPSGGGVLYIYPGGQTVPTASALNWTTNQTAANLSIAASATNNIINFYNNSPGTIQLIVDTNGYFN